MESGGLSVMICLDKMKLMWHVASSALSQPLNMELFLTWGMLIQLVCVCVCVCVCARTCVYLMSLKC